MPSRDVNFAGSLKSHCGLLRQRNRAVKGYQASPCGGTAAKTSNIQSINVNSYVSNRD